MYYSYWYIIINNNIVHVARILLRCLSMLYTRADTAARHAKTIVIMNRNDAGTGILIYANLAVTYII